MRVNKRVLTATISLLVLIGGSIGIAEAAVGAQPVTSTSSSTYSIVGGKDGHVVGNAHIAYAPAKGTVTISLDPASGYSFRGGAVCLGENSSANTSASYFSYKTGFTARVNGGASSSACPPTSGSGYFVYRTFTGTGPWLLTGVPAGFYSDGMYLQIHVDVNNGNTGYPCAVIPKKGSYYGNCADPGVSTPLPVGTVGGFGAAIFFGGALVFVQRRKERVLRGRAASV